MENKNKIFDERQCESMILKIAHQINARYDSVSNPIVVVGVMNGAFMVLSTLCKMLNVAHKVDTVKVSSYIQGQQKAIQLIGDLKEDISDCHIILVEDIVDSGNTILFLKEHLIKKHAITVTVATLLKRSTCEVECEFVGAEITDDAFVYGYGLDTSDGLNRSLQGIYVELK